MLDLNALQILCNEQFSQIVPCYIEFDTLGVRSQKKKKKKMGNSASSGTKIKTMT